MTDSTPLRGWMASPQAWNLAVALVQGTAGESDGGSAEARAELERAGITSDGVLDSMWGAVIRQTITANATFRVVSVFNGLAYLCDVSVGQDVATSLTRRLAVEPDGSGEFVAMGADPQIEFVVASASHVWPLIRRVLPPIDEVRAEPQQTPAARRVEHVIDEQLIALARQSLDSAAIDPKIRDAFRARATIMIQHTIFSGNHSQPDIGIGMRAWLVGDEGLYSIERHDGTVGVYEVAPGDVGFGVVWYALGARDRTVAAGGEDEGAQS